MIRITDEELTKKAASGLQRFPAKPIRNAHPDTVDHALGAKCLFVLATVGCQKSKQYKYQATDLVCNVKVARQRLNKWHHNPRLEERADIHLLPIFEECQEHLQLQEQFK